MKITSFRKLVLASALMATLYPAATLPAQTTPGKTTKPIAAKTPPKAIPLAFRDFFEPTPREMKLSDKLQSLNGKRVQITGFIAQLEKPPKGAFYLCARPVSCDEAGGGTGDLPPETIRVIVRGAKNKTIQSISRPVIVTGILEVGNRAEADGTLSSIRLTLDRPQPLPAKPTAAASIRKPNPAKLTIRKS